MYYSLLPFRVFLSRFAGSWGSVREKFVILFILRKISCLPLHLIRPESARSTDFHPEKMHYMLLWPLTTCCTFVFEILRPKGSSVLV
jgi:hypothetical protein